MKRSLLLFLFIGAIAGIAFIPKTEDPIEKLVSSLQKWAEANPQEKVYLHMDKPYYAIGDTIWFKAYVTIGSRHQLSALSGALYVELLNEKDSLQQTLKLPVTAGMSMGDFVLTDTLNEGNYRLRAYTRWMRNAGEDYFYDHTFMVGNAFSNQVTASVAYKYNTIGSKPAVTAMLNYKDDQGRPLSLKEVGYEIISNGSRIAFGKQKTDTSGNISISILNDQRSDLQRAYLRTSIRTDKKETIIKSFAVKAALSKSDVQFFPESGSLVNGMASRVGFKAVGVNGTGIGVKGVVTDNQGNEVARFESGHAGMGTFTLSPEKGKSYQAKISYADGSECNIELPKSLDQGYVLSVYQTDHDSLLVRINASKELYESTPRSVSLIVQSAGELIYGSQVKISRALTSLWLAKKDFPTGISQFTLFSDRDEPLNERIVFIKNPDQMSLKLSTAKTAYKSREKVVLSLESKDRSGNPVGGNFSVSVIDESKVPSDETSESTILSNMLLSSELKGYIEKPNYYFIKDTEETDKALDNLMLTQGYRRFVWKEMLNPSQAPAVYKAEQLGDKISGRVVTLNNKPVVKGKVTLMSLGAGIIRDTLTDGAGRFGFDNLVLTDGLRFAVQARTVKNGSQVEVVMDSIPKQGLRRTRNMADINLDIAEQAKVYLENSRKQDEALDKVGGLSRVHRLREVKIKAQKQEDLKYASQGIFQIPEGHADRTYIMEDGDQCASLGLCLQGKLGQITFRSYDKDGCTITHYPYSGPSVKRDVPMQVIVDGRKIVNGVELAGIFDNNVLNPTDVAKIDVVRTNMALISLLDAPSLLIITKGIKTKKPGYNPSMVNISPKGFNKAREFYSPRYDQKDSGTQLPDLRSTIYWNPALKTDGEGRASFYFFNADGPGSYKVVVEGIDAAGELGRQVYRFDVEL